MWLQKFAAMKLLDLSFGQELKKSFSNKPFLVLNSMFRKNEKINCHKKSQCLRFTRNRRSY